MAQSRKSRRSSKTARKATAKRRQYQGAQRSGSGFAALLDGVAGLGPWMTKLLALVVLVTLGLVVMAVHKAYGFGLAALVGFMSALGMMIAADMVSRRRWERDLARRFGRLTRENERMARDLSRTRNELAGLKQGLARTGMELRQQAGRGRVAEARMLQAIIDRMVELGAAEPMQISAPEGRQGAELHGLSDYSASGVSVHEIDEDNAPLNQKAKPVTREKDVLAMLKSALQNDNIHLFAQSIVTLPQRKRRFAEFFTRLRAPSGEYVAATQFMKVAEGREMVTTIDNLLLLRCIQYLRDSGAHYARNHDVAMLDGYFCNIAPETLNDAGFMNDLVEFISANRDMAPRMIFEMAQSDLATLNPATVSVLDGLSRLGCRFSMDGVVSLGFDTRQLVRRHIRFIKLDAGRLMQEIRDDQGYRRVQRLKAELDRAGIDLIVEKIETERQLVELLDLGIDYGQGYLFGKPSMALDQNAA